MGEALLGKWGGGGRYESPYFNVVASRFEE